MDRKIKKISLHLFAFFRILNYIYFTLEEKDTLVFIEVKYRKNASYGYPWEAISVEKQKRIYYVAKQYLLKYRWKGQIRFDVISICGNEISWFRNAFYDVFI